MRNISGWTAGLLGAGALAGAFYLGGHTLTTALARGTAPDTAVELRRAPLAVACEPGQRAVVRAIDGGSRVTCETDPQALGQPEAYTRDPMTSPVLRVTASVTGSARPAVLTEPVEVYRPRARSVTSRRIVEPSHRSWERSAVVIGSSAIVGAAAGAVVKGRKGAVIGGLLGGGAATVWDQITRRRQAADR